MAAQPAFRELVRRLPRPSAVASAGGLPGSAAALTVAALVRQQAERIWVIVAKSPAGAESFEADLRALLDGEAVALFPQRETLPYEAAEHHVEVSGLRVEALEAVLSGRARVLVTTARALQERAEIPSALAELRLMVRVGQAIAPRDLADRLEAMGFERASLVEAVGQFALRGGILDLFGFGAADPLRIEFWGDEIASIRNFDVLDQRSTNELESADVLPVDLRRATEHGGSATPRRSLLDVLSRDAVLVVLDAEALPRELRVTWDEVVHLHDAEARRGGHPDAPASLFLDPADAVERIGAFGRIELNESPSHESRLASRESAKIGRAHV